MTDDLKGAACDLQGHPGAPQPCQDEHRDERKDNRLLLIFCQDADEQSQSGDAQGGAHCHHQSRQGLDDIVQPQDQLTECNQNQELAEDQDKNRQIVSEQDVDAPGGGGDLNVALLANSDYQTDKNLAEGVIAMMGDIGLKVTLNALSGKDFDNARDSGKYDWVVVRNGTELITVVQNTTALAPVGPTTDVNHRANGAGELDLLPHEQQLVDTINAFIGTRDPAERKELMKTYQKVYTENLDTIGLTAYPGALIINKRFANIPAGAPIFMYNWAEDNIIRERVFVPEDKQIDAELHPDTLPGEPGSAGPVKAN